MKKKILSLILSMVVIVGAMPVMNLLTVSAAGGTSYLADDFEAFTVGDVFVNSAVTESNLSTYEKTFTNITDNSNINNWKIGRDVKAEIVNVTGMDGDTSNKAMKLSLWRGGGIGAGTTHPVRFGHTKGTAPSSGTLVTEMKIYYPGGEDKGFFRFMMGEMFLAENVLRQQKSSGAHIGDLKKGAWNKITLVTNIVGSSKKTVYYINDKVVSYNELDYAYSYNYTFRFEVAGTKDITKEYLIIDDVNWYYSPSATTVSSTFPAVDATEVSRAAKPTFTFNEKLLDWEYNSAASAVINNVTDGTTVGATLSQSADDKTLTVTPATTLDYGKEYSVSLIGVKDMYDAAVTVAPITFTTKEQSKFDVSEPTFTNEKLFTGIAGTRITKLESGTISCSYSVTNNDTSAKPVLMLVVLKENDVLKNFQFKTVTLATGETAEFNGGFVVGDAANTVIEIYTWDSLVGMNPLGAMYHIDADGIDSTEE